MKALFAALAAAVLSIAAAHAADTHKGAGVVTGVDRSAGKVALKHAPIPIVQEGKSYVITSIR